MLPIDSEFDLGWMKTYQSERSVECYMKGSKMTEMMPTVENF